MRRKQYCPKCGEVLKGDYRPKKKVLVVDPVYDVNDKFNYDKLGFLRGFVKHYKHTEVTPAEIFNYLENLV
ncbi:MAG: hypothetical protein IPJ03_16885 [Ignavibacteriales bacterium]|nr:hypothetical protein [Ignavibacteriales bacterium]